MSDFGQDLERQRLIPERIWNDHRPAGSAVAAGGLIRQLERGSPAVDRADAPHGPTGAYQRAY